MKKYLILLLLFIWVLFQTQMFSYSWEIIWDIKCSEINSITRYQNLSLSIITKIDLIWDKINNKYTDKDNTYKEKIYNLYIKVLNQYLEKTQYTEVQKEVLLRIWDYFVCKKEWLINKENLDVFNVKIIDITDHSAKVIWEWNSEVQTWLYVKKTEKTGVKHYANNNIYDYKILASNYEFTLFVQAKGSDVIKEVDFRTLSTNIALWNTIEEDEVINESNNWAKLLFKSSFNNGIIIDKSDVYAHRIRGIDSVSGFNWVNDIPGDGERNYFNYVIPVEEYPNYQNYVETRIANVTVPNSSATKALYIEYKNSSGGLPTRNMYDMFAVDDRSDPVNRFDEGYIKEKIKIDWETTGIDWIDFWEIKSEDEGYRFGLYIQNIGSENLGWAVICLDNYDNKWRGDNFNVPVKKNEWFEIEVYWKVIDETKGIFKFAVDGEIVFDKVEILTGRRDVPFYFMPFKAYGTKNHQWITDFEYWDKPPSTSILWK